MQVAFHVGVHGTDEDRVMRFLQINHDLLERRRVEVSPKEINEPILNEALLALKGGIASPEMEEVVLDALLESDGVSRLIFSRPTFLGLPRRAFDADGLLAAAGPKMRALANVLPSAECEFFMALKNPATYVPDALRRAARQGAEVVTPLDPEEMRWAPTLRRAVRELGGRRLVLWCHEDTPLVFPEVMRRLTGIPAGEPLAGEMLMAERVLTDAGREALARRLQAEAPASVAERRRITSAVLEAHHDPEAIRLRIDLPGWSQQTVDRMTAAYDADVAEIAALPGVEFIGP